MGACRGCPIWPTRTILPSPAVTRRPPGAKFLCRDARLLHPNAVTYGESSDTYRRIASDSEIAPGMHPPGRLRRIRRGGSMVSSRSRIPRARPGSHSAPAKPVGSAARPRATRLRARDMDVVYSSARVADAVCGADGRCVPEPPTWTGRAHETPRPAGRYGDTRRKSSLPYRDIPERAKAVRKVTTSSLL
jgi:hypothetical protein